ncbi:MAG: hypothetical protein IPM23_01710 [Candidatus Melainabacteria bacterium]|nr:hypothetical protein [Candidatus Melainabacteria bacterium]
MKKLLVLIFSIPYAILSIIAIGAVYGFAPMLISIIWSGVGIATIMDLADR